MTSAPEAARPWPDYDQPREGLALAWLTLALLLYRVRRAPPPQRLPCLLLPLTLAPAG
jgi:hypothetical protein